MAIPKKIEISEVGPRDGLQNQPSLIGANAKIAFINSLSKSGLSRIEVSGFVNPKWVPQLQDADEVFSGIERNKDVIYTAIVPNLHGWERAYSANVDEISVLTAASEQFCEKNINTSIRGSIKRLAPIIKMAHANQVRVRCYISCAVACPYSGPTLASELRDLTARLMDLGIDDLDFSDTIGIALPIDIQKLFDVLDGMLSPEELNLHLHNTNEKALDCAKLAMECGVWKFDTSCGGLGGCPYAPGAAGNLATEDLVHMASDLGIETGIDLKQLIKSTSIIADALQCTMPSKIYNKVINSHGDSTE